MPIGHLVKQHSPRADDLKNRLQTEWNSPTNAGEPVLIEEHSDRIGGSIHLYVIWSEWGTLSQRERSEVIMGAFQATHNAQTLLDVTVAMGLTPEEATRMGISYQLENKQA